MGFLSPNPAPAPPPRPKVVTTTGGRSTPGGGGRDDTRQPDDPGSRITREPGGEPSPAPDPDPKRKRDRHRESTRDRDAQGGAEDEAGAEEGADPPLRRKNSGIQETVLTSSAGVLTERFDGPTRKRLLGG